VVAIYMATK